MDLSWYVDRLGRELAVAAEAGGDDARALAERFTAPLDSAVRLALLDALSAAADEITRELAPGSVELRLRGGEPSFAVRPPPAEQPPAGPAAHDVEAVSGGPAASASGPVADTSGTEDGAMSRINFRLPEQLKARVEEAAAAEGRSVNAWLVRAASAALQPQDSGPRPERPGARSPQHYTGWVR